MSLRRLRLPFSAMACSLAVSFSCGLHAQSAPSTAVAGTFSDYSTEAPGTFHKITVADLPKPYATPSADPGSRVIPRPEGAWPKVPEGFKVDLYATGLKSPRLIRRAPNGDLFIANSYANSITVLRGTDAEGKAQTVQVFAADLNLPFGIAFYPAGPNPQWIYVGNTDSVVRIPYRSGDLKARGPAEKLADLPGGGKLRGGGHWTRDVVFSRDGKRMFVSVGSNSNVDDVDNNPVEEHRADVLEFTPEGKFVKVYASGIRNCVSEAIQPQSGELWCSTNERDGLGDNLVPDYITHVQEGAFYGWPWYYMGSNQDPRHDGKHPELRGKVVVPDVLLQPHFASLEMLFYDGAQFPAEYKGAIFASEHGSWNKSKRAGYEVVRVPMRGTRADGSFEDFMTGFVLPNGDVWGRPVGITTGTDGSLFVTDDGSNSVWHVTYTGQH